VTRTVRVIVDGCLLSSSSSELPFPGQPGKATRGIVNLLFGGVAGMRAGGGDSVSVVDRLGAPMAQGELRLDPLAEAHRDRLKAACGEDREIWPIYAVSYDPEHFDASFDSLISRPNGQAFAIFDGDRLAGMSAYLGIEPERGVIEIGNTYYVPALRGTGFNRRVKDLMIRRAIDCGFRRIEFRVDSRNLRSQAAMTKLGAVREGVIRAERITWTGHVRDTVLFSILANEWPPRSG
jgi:RimJ/RimL family protein N-acetyltransferase